jgi:hypothetical protein
VPQDPAPGEVGSSEVEHGSFQIFSFVLLLSCLFQAEKKKTRERKGKQRTTMAKERKK